MLSCKEFVEQQNQKLDGKEFSFGQRMSHLFHWMMCHHCRRYLRQLKLVDDVGSEISTAEVSELKVQDNLNHLNNSLSDAEK